MNERQANVASMLASYKLAKTCLKKGKYKPGYLMQPKRFYV